MSAETVKLCIDCKHYVPSPPVVANDPAYDSCVSPQNVKQFSSLVRGTPIPKWNYCMSARSGLEKTDCGQSARWFEPKLESQP